MEIKFVRYYNPSGAPIWFCVDAKDTDVFSHTVGSGIMEFPESCKFAQRYFQRADIGASSCFVDVGANVGLFTLALASCGIDTISIEALAKNYLLLCAALAKNSFSAHVIPIQAAASDKFALLHVQGESAWGHVSSTGVPVAGIPVVQLLDILGATQPTLVKIDVEGYEGHVIAGMKPLLAGDVDIIIEIFATQMNSLADLEANGYQPYLFAKDRLIRTSSSKFNPPFVADYFCTKKQLNSTFAGSEIRDYSIDNVIELARIESACPVEAHRISIASRLKTAPKEIREHPAIIEMIAALRNDKDTRVVHAATW